MLTKNDSYVNINKDQQKHEKIKDKEAKELVRKFELMLINTLITSFLFCSKNLIKKFFKIFLKKC